MKKEIEFMYPSVAMIMGSISDLPKLEPAIDLLKEFGVSCEVRVMSAHRSPDVVADYAKKAVAAGLKVIIAAAGGAAHLPGVIAAYTILPVIGVPIALPVMNGLDSLLSISQMPAGIPVATMSAGSGGPENAALMAVSILALNDKVLADKLMAYRRGLAEKVIERDSNLQWKMRSKEQEEDA